MVDLCYWTSKLPLAKGNSRDERMPQVSIIQELEQDQFEDNALSPLYSGISMPLLPHIYEFGTNGVQLNESWISGMKILATYDMHITNGGDN